MFLLFLINPIKGFLWNLAEEAKEIIDMGRPEMRESPVTLMDKDKGKQAKEFRTSTQARLKHRNHPLLREIDERVASLTRVPIRD